MNNPASFAAPGTGPGESHAHDVLNQLNQKLMRVLRRADHDAHKRPKLLARLAELVQQWGVPPAQLHQHLHELGPAGAADYGCIFMNSSFGALHVAAHQVGVAQAHFNIGAMKKTPLPLPGAPEQTEIVRRVETLFAFADRLKARLAQAQTAVDRLTPSLLAKAFRGELVPQDPADEPAADLLQRLRGSIKDNAANIPARKRAARQAACAPAPSSSSA